MKWLLTKSIPETHFLNFISNLFNTSKKVIPQRLEWFSLLDWENKDEKRIIIFRPQTNRKTNKLYLCGIDPHPSLTVTFRFFSSNHLRSFKQFFKSFQNDKDFFFQLFFSFTHFLILLISWLWKFEFYIQDNKKL
jgi:hypothetical protein